MNPFAHLQAAGQSDRGRCRWENQDAFTLLTSHGMFCVADGIGGSVGGGGASLAVVQSLEKIVGNLPSPDAVQTAKGKSRLIRHAVARAGSWIHEEAARANYPATGTTVVAMAFDAGAPDQACILHAGDSPALRWREDTLEQLTREHSFAAESGVADPDTLPPALRNTITRAVGPAATCVLEETAVAVMPGDRYILCSDGLTHMVPPDQLAELMRPPSSPKDLAHALVQAANEAGGADNVTVVVIQVGDYH